MKLDEAILILRPGARFKFENQDLATLVWLDQAQTRPTDAEIIATLNG
jgi:hypothetical protein